jgi:excisionase family DNA binding protein
MNVSKEKIDALVEWLSPRVGSLINHGEKVRQILAAAKRPDEIVQSAINLVNSGESSIDEDSTSTPALAPEQLAVWKAMLPVLAEHGLLSVQSGGPALEPDRPMTKSEAADYLGIKLRKLETCMRKRQIAYEKMGTGKTSAVRFHRADLDKYRASKTVAAKRNHE